MSAEQDKLREVLGCGKCDLKCKLPTKRHPVMGSASCAGLKIGALREQLQAEAQHAEHWKQQAHDAANRIQEAKNAMPLGRVWLGRPLPEAIKELTDDYLFALNKLLQYRKGGA